MSLEECTRVKQVWWKCKHGEGKGVLLKESILVDMRARHVLDAMFSLICWKRTQARETREGGWVAVLKNFPTEELTGGKEH